MLGKISLKYPILIIGVIFFVIFWTNPKTKEMIDNYRARFIPSTCKSLKERLDQKMPKEWEITCRGTEFLVLETTFTAQLKSNRVYKAAMYRESLNILSRFSKLANPETLEVLRRFQLIFRGRVFDLKLQTDGQALVTLSKIDDPKKILDHIRLTVKSLEIPN